MYLVKFSALLSTLLVYEELPMSWLDYHRYQKMRFITWKEVSKKTKQNCKQHRDLCFWSKRVVFIHRKSRVRVL